MVKSLSSSSAPHAAATLAAAGAGLNRGPLSPVLCEHCQVFIFGCFLPFLPLGALKDALRVNKALRVSLEALVPDPSIPDLMKNRQRAEKGPMSLAFKNRLISKALSFSWTCAPFAFHCICLRLSFQNHWVSSSATFLV